MSKERKVKKGIILAGGSGTRLKPITDFVCKQLLPVYDKPMVYYPLTTLILLGITDILIISTPRDLPLLKDAIGDGSRIGVTISYEIQEEPRGLPDAFIIGEKFIGDDPVCMILGDNILHLSNFHQFFEDCQMLEKGAWVTGAYVSEPQHFGVINRYPDGSIKSLVEKPEVPESNVAAIGLYFYDSSVVEKAKSLKPSKRGELEIMELNKLYLDEGNLKAKYLTRGASWMDAGQFDNLLDVSNFIRIVEKQMGLKIGCIEEAAYHKGLITKKELSVLASEFRKSPYGEYLRGVLAWN